MRSAVILAAGKGTRMYSQTPKVMHEVLGKTMILHVIDSLKAAGISKIVVVLGHEAKLVKASLGHKEVEFVLQTEQLGTAHALLQAKSILENVPGNTVVVCGDTPLLRSETIGEMLRLHESDNAACTVLTGMADDPTGYGRIIRNDLGNVEAIVEEKDASLAQKKIKEFNSGTYCFSNENLFENLSRISNKNQQQEYYLPDLIALYHQMHAHVCAFKIEDTAELIGVNDRIALAEVTKILKHRVNHQWQLRGVTLMDVDSTYIGVDVHIDNDVIIEPNVMLLGQTTIGSGAYIGMNSHISDSSIGSACRVEQSVITDSVVGNQTMIGPFAHLRMHAIVGDQVRLGNFVEIKNSRIGNKTAAAHLTYVGDSDVGDKVNFGCGSITVNYDGRTKSKTIIKDEVFIGCNVNLIAPVTVEKGAYVAAGSTITKDVPEESLSIARMKQSNKEGYVRKLKMHK